MNPEHYRKLAGLLRRRRRIDVQVKTVLTRTGIEKKIVVPDVPLLAAGAEVRRVAHPLPRGRRQRSLPAQFTDWRRCIRKPKESLLSAPFDPFAYRLTLRSHHPQLWSGGQLD